MRSILLMVSLIAVFSLYIYVDTNNLDITKPVKTIVNGNSREELNNIEIIRCFLLEIVNKKLDFLIDIHFAENYNGSFEKKGFPDLTDREYLKLLIKESRFPFNYSSIKLDSINTDNNRVFAVWTLEDNKIPIAHCNNSKKFIHAVFYLENGKIIKSIFYYVEI